MNGDAFDTTAAEWSSFGRNDVRLWVAIACMVAALLCALAGERLLRTSSDLGPDENLKRTDRLVLY
jgi:hypothetical protein